MARQNATDSPSKPSARRARTVRATVLEPSEHRADSQVVTEEPPSEAQILDLLENEAIRRKRVVNLSDGEQADAYVVDFLPDFEIDQRSDSTARRVPCGEVTGIGGIYEEIQARFVPRLGPGRYRITRRSGGKLKGQWVENVRAPQPIITPDSNETQVSEEWEDEIPANAEEGISARELRAIIENVRLKAELDAIKRYQSQPPPQTQVQPQRPQPPPKTLLEQLREMKEIKELLSDEPAQQTAPALTPEVILAKAIVENPSKFGAFTERLMAKVLGANEEEDSASWAKVAARGVELLAENLPSVVQALTALRAQPAINATMQQTAPNAPAQPIAPHDPMAAYQDLFSQKLFPLLQGNGSTAQAAAEVRAFLVRFPQFTDAVYSFVGMPVPELLATLAHIPEAAQLVQLPHAAQWLEAFRDELVEDEPEDQLKAATAGA